MGCCFRAGAESTAKSLTLPVDKTGANLTGLIHPTCFQWCAVYASGVAERILLWGWIKKSFLSPKRDIRTGRDVGAKNNTILFITISYICKLNQIIIFRLNFRRIAPIKCYLSIVAVLLEESRHILPADGGGYCHRQSRYVNFKIER